MAESFKRLTARAVGETRVRVGGYTVPVGGRAIVIGTSIANVLDGTTSVTLEHHDGTNYTRLIKAVPLDTAQAFAPLGEMNKVVLEPGDGLFVTASVAASVDVLVSILEIT